MKVLKFGGTSIGDATNIRRVCEIVASRASQPVVLVFSAMGSTTDRLVEIGLPAVPALIEGDAGADILHGETAIPWPLP